MDRFGLFFEIQKVLGPNVNNIVDQQLIKQLASVWMSNNLIPD